jgi:uncharacterized membrane protein YeaQ/YmgE (transglycosylase-associated protein family)
MFNLIWYVVIGFLAGFAAKSIEHTHLTLAWTIGLGIVGSVIGGCITHLFSRPREGAPFHPAGIVFSIIGSLLALYLWHKFNMRLSAG